MLFNVLLYRIRSGACACAQTCLLSHDKEEKKKKQTKNQKKQAYTHTQLLAHFYGQLNILIHWFACGINFIEEVGQHTSSVFMCSIEVSCRCKYKCFVIIRVVVVCIVLLLLLMWLLFVCVCVFLSQKLK